MSKPSLLSAILFTSICLISAVDVDVPAPVKQIDRTAIAISPNHRYASPFEVSNLEYNAFLEDLKKAGKKELYAKCKYDSTQWQKQFGYAYNEPMATYYHTHPAYNNYPVVNIPWEGAVVYCDWLTAQYNQKPKRKFKQVQFRLPTVKEWLQLADPMPGAPFPWYGSFVYDDKGEFKSNVKFKQANGEVNYFPDGSVFTGPVKSYPPTKAGLYNLIGNVAEMLNVNGVAIGGSWDHFPEECQLDQRQHYNGPDPRVGFRWVMEVVED